jgi:hypothetical protein
MSFTNAAVRSKTGQWLDFQRIKTAFGKISALHIGQNPARNRVLHAIKLHDMFM